MLTPEAVAEFKTMYMKKYNIVSLDDKTALELATRLYNLVKIVLSK